MIAETTSSDKDFLAREVAACLSSVASSRWKQRIIKEGKGARQGAWVRRKDENRDVPRTHRVVVREEVGGERVGGCPVALRDSEERRPHVSPYNGDQIFDRRDTTRRIM